MSWVVLGNDSLDMKLVFRYEQNKIYDCENTVWRENTLFFSYAHRGRCGRDRLVVGFTTVYAIIAYNH